MPEESPPSPPASETAALRHSRSAETRTLVKQIVAKLQTSERGVTVDELLIKIDGRRTRRAEDSHNLEDDSSDDELDSRRDAVSKILELLAATPLVSREPRRGDRIRKKKAYRYRWGYDIGVEPLSLDKLKTCVAERTAQRDAAA